MTNWVVEQGPIKDSPRQNVKLTITIPLRIVTAAYRNDEHLLLIKALQPFSGSHLMAINTIKDLGPALGNYIYTPH
ncbi:hypothetical protein L195_g061514 [Trifolium pratense]|uniref:Uncharacterized protein n=1 Tax=Trifolium pratense TaxID=57577 RepID=A0A2K3KA83_TRIPR|nr:hypothetical protein L195_g061514 [Trifolium pratense]